MARVKLTIKETNAMNKLTAIAQNVYTEVGLELPKDFRLLTTRPRQFSKSFAFGKTYGLLVLISRAYNNPQNKDEKFDIDVQLDNNEEQLELLSNIDPELLEEIRESNGYHSFVVKDENDIPNDIFDGIEPDKEMALSSSTEMLKHLKLDSLTNVLACEAEIFDMSRWDKAEDKALSSARAELAEAESLKTTVKLLEEQV